MNTETTESPRVKIYFCGSIRGVAPNLPLYQAVVDHMDKFHGDVLTKHVAYPSLESKSWTDKEIFEKDYEKFNASQVMVSEISVPSHGVGIELGWGMLRENYPILSLFNSTSEFKVSGLVAGCPKIELVKYDPTDLKSLLEKIDDFFKRVAVGKK